MSTQKIVYTGAWLCLTTYSRVQEAFMRSTPGNSDTIRQHGDRGSASN